MRPISVSVGLTAESGLNLIAERERGRDCFDIPPRKGEAVYLAWQIGFGWGCQSTHGVPQVHPGYRQRRPRTKL